MTHPLSLPAAPGAASRPAPPLLAALDAATDAAPTAEKLLLGPDINWGRELLVTLARRRGGWIGWRATNLRSIADELALVALSDARRRIGSDIEIGARVNRALDEAIAAGAVSSLVAGLQRSLGFRTLLRDAVLELRAAGATPAMLRDASGRGTPARDVAAVLAIYEARLDASDVTDAAGVFAAALAAFEAEAPFVLPAHVHVAPSLVARGLPGQLLARLLARGAYPLGSEPVVGIELPRHAAGRVAREMELVVDAAEPGRPSPLAYVGATVLPEEGSVDRSAVSVELFAAATPSDELREVFRRVIAEGLRWDAVEIVATDPDTYGIALDVLSQRVGVGATMLHGIPFTRTRLGRALDRWLRWLEDGLPADVLRQALEAGELCDPERRTATTALAGELRRLRIGWGRARYEQALAELAERRDAATVDPRDGESPEELAARIAARRRTAGALHELLAPLLAALPPVPERGSDVAVQVTTAQLAAATRTWLALVPKHGMAEQQATDRLDERLAELAALDEPALPFTGAMAALRQALGDLRAWPLVTNERKPWSAAGGMVHLTDLAHAGLTGRPRTFVVGLDADRAGAAERQDPLLTDVVRQALEGALATGAERRVERAHAIARALAALRGHVTLSWSTSGSLDGRELGPAPVLLQAMRIVEGNGALTYEELRARVAPPVCAVPERLVDGRLASGALLDARDVWLDAIADGALLLDASKAVRAGFPMLDAGLAAIEAAAGRAGVERLRIPAEAAAALDPRTTPDAPVSPSSLELLAKCPLAWLYRRGMSLHAPQDPEYDADRWLDAAERGALLHRIFEDFARAFGERRRLGAERERSRAVLRETTERCILAWRDEIPPPSEVVFASEAEEVRRSAVAFLETETEQVEMGDRGEWQHLELAFGFDGQPARHYPVRGGELAIRGRIDRIDVLPSGALRVVDYKTGSTWSYTRKSGTPFGGGRNLQPGVYAAIAADVLKQPVEAFEYRFPTVKGAGEVVRYEAEELHEVRTIVDRILEHARKGAFVPTTDANDCAWCDYRPICRVGDRSPRAVWGAAHASALPEYAELLANRGGAPAGGEDA